MIVPEAKFGWMSDTAVTKVRLPKTTFKLAKYDVDNYEPC